MLALEHSEEYSHMRDTGKYCENLKIWGKSDF